MLEWRLLQCHLAGDLPEEEEEEGRKNTRVWIASCLSYILLYLSVVWVAGRHSTSQCIVDCRVPHQKRHDKWAILASSPRGMRTRAGGEEDKDGRNAIVSNVYVRI